MFVNYTQLAYQSQLQYIEFEARKLEQLLKDARAAQDTRWYLDLELSIAADIDAAHRLGNLATHQVKTLYTQQESIAKRKAAHFENLSADARLPRLAGLEKQNEEVLLGLNIDETRRRLEGLRREIHTRKLNEQHSRLFGGQSPEQNPGENGYGR